MRYQFETKKEPLYSAPIHSLSPTPHIHSHLELIYLKAGSSITTVDGKDFLLKDGDFFLSFPNQVHFYNDQSPVQGYLLIFTPDIFKDLKEIFRTKIPCSPIIRLDRSHAELECLLEYILAKNGSDDPLAKVSAKGCLIALLGELLSHTTLTNAPADYDNVKNLLIYCSDNYTEPLSLDLVSQKLHLSKFYISHIFNEKLHISFPTFINSLRVEHACTLLKKGANITDIALSSGFSSVRTFNRTFTEQMGMTPSDYIKRKNRD